MRLAGSARLAGLVIAVALVACKGATSERDITSPSNPGPDPGPDPGWDSDTNPDESEPGERGFSDVIPSQRWPDVPGRVVGLLYQRGQQPWGEALHHAGAFLSDRDLKRTEYAFSTDGSSPYALYFLSPNGGGNNHISRWQVETPGGVTHFDAAMFEASTPNSWGLQHPAHIVEIEVNQGRGGRGLHFVATDLRVLDGHERIPADPTAQLVQVRERFDLLVNDNRPALKRMYAESSRRANARADEHEQWVQAQFFKATIEHVEASERVALAPTWRVETHELAVIIVYRRAASVTVHTHRPRSTGGMDHGPQHSESEFGFGVRLGARYVVSAQGEVALEEVLRVEDASWVTEL
ncbi:hypothetical protein [Enhygromyxa salina]|uniref:Lipoprotein n=1 Tax=Enhygromyxa salina TaxID=215803 RepID=A0A2S9YNJ2_9BACT|nr:hypothetical protein [Enhygromyxa salina]PRQ06661.1 hypothetical protein ENSA7_35370 [Enhygromyxa salina]